jgi:hypothetical protein
MRCTRWIHVMGICMALVAAVSPASGLQQTITLPQQARELRERPTTVFSVGKEEGESWELLSRVQAAAFDDQGHVYILDGANHRVLVFEPSGTFVRQIGGQGDGPGEITFATGIAITQDGRLVIADVGRAAFSIFAPDGTYQRQVSWGEETRIALGFQSDGRGGVLARVNPMIRMQPGQDLSSLPNKATIRHHPLTEGGAFKTLFEFELPRPQITSAGGANNQRMQVRLVGAPTFSPQVTWGSLPGGGIALVDTENYAIRVMDADGKPVRIVARADKVRPVTDRDRDRARDRQRKILSGEIPGQGGMTVTNNNGRMSYGFGGPPTLPSSEIEERIREMQFAENMPLIEAISTDPTGRIWVERTTSSEDIGPIELITADGRYIGTVRAIARPAAVSRDGARAAWIETDELGVERVVVRTLPASWK